jgi:hypothetical protein
MNLLKQLEMKNLNYGVKLNEVKKVAVKSYKVERGKGSNKDVEDTFVREFEALNHPFIL